MSLNLTTPVLKLPALAWVFICLFFWIVAALLPRPEPFPEPEEVAVIFRDPVVVEKREGKFELVKEEKKIKEIKPLWVVFPKDPPHQEVKKPVQWLFGWDGKRFSFGMYKLHSKWTYTLISMRCDTEPANRWLGPLELSADDLKMIRPMLIGELNERFKETKGEAGTWIDRVLDEGIEETSYLCVQNAVIVLAWLLMLPVVVAVMAIFAPAEKTADAAAPPPSVGQSS